MLEYYLEQTVVQQHSAQLPKHKQHPQGRTRPQTPGTLLELTSTQNPLSHGA